MRWTPTCLQTLPLPTRVYCTLQCLGFDFQRYGIYLHPARPSEKTEAAPAPAPSQPAPKPAPAPAPATAQAPQPVGSEQPLPRHCRCPSCGSHSTQSNQWRGRSPAALERFLGRCRPTSAPAQPQLVPLIWRRGANHIRSFKAGPSNSASASNSTSAAKKTELQERGERELAEAIRMSLAESQPQPSPTTSESKGKVPRPHQ
ncbi:hypothetical protein DFH08DRAFT_467333 [Mycena albidolilacea]|uniref:Uncharacterized protein n=1 Tax=Mycena albidolilacea TaxID=1033008 RepID=A0AAD7EZU5_9AGAR|nr:hypothetical protein DFH08DRAFT_467333 [Mycena albidolilacea]